MENKKIVAVVMPYHNGMSNFIESAMLGVARQLGVITKLYLVDNGSTDETRTVAMRTAKYISENFKDCHVTKISCDVPGVAFARNVALDEVESKIFNSDGTRREGVIDAPGYVAFCDCDDVWDPHHLVTSILRLGNTLAMTYSDVNCVDEDGNSLQIYGIPVYDNFNRSNLLKQNFIFISSVVMRADCLVGGFDHDADPMGDWDYWLRVSAKHIVEKRDENRTVTYLWKTKSGSYYSDEKMARAYDYVKAKHNIKEVPGWLTDGEAQTLMKYGRGGMCLEIGSYKGKSARHIASVCEKLFCVDTFMCSVDGQTQTEHSIYEDFRNNTSEFGNIVPITGKSSDVHDCFANDTFDMIFLDAMHDYDSVREDLSNYWAKLKLGGYLLMHDFANPDYPGVRRAAEEKLGEPVCVVDSIAVYLKKVYMREADAKEKESKKLAEEKIEGDKVVLISPFAQVLPDGSPNPKSPPVQFWHELVVMLKAEGIYTVHVGVPGERLIGADEIAFNLSKDAIENVVSNASTFVCADTMLQHVGAHVGKTGVVIFSQSDPLIFGHSSNVNILKSREYLRANQYQLWTQTPYIYDSFPSVNQVFTEIMKLI